MASPTLDYERIKQNLNSMLDQNAPKEHLDQYIASEGTTLEELKAIGAQRAQAALTPQAAPEPPVEGFIDRTTTALGDIPEAIARGYYGAKTGLNVLGLESGYLTPEEAAVNIAASTEAAKQYAMPESVRKGMEEIQNAQGWKETGLAIAKNLDVIPSVLGESISSSAVSMGTGLIGGLLGAGTGSVIPGFGTAVGATVGLSTGVGAGSAATEYASSLNQFLTSKGVNTSDPDQLKTAFSNPDLMSEARSDAATRGIAVGVFDALSAGIAGRLFAPVKKALGDKALGTAAGTGAEIISQSGAGAAGEATAQVATEGEITSPGAVALEAVGEIVPGIGEAVISKATGARTTAESPIPPPSSLREQALVEFYKTPGATEAATDADRIATEQLAAENKAEADRLAAATPTAVVPPTTTEYGTAVPTAVPTTEQPATTPIPQTTTEFGAAATTPTAKEPAAPAVQSDSVKLANIYIDKLTEQNRPELVNKVRAIIATNDDTIINTGLSAVDTVYDMIKSGTLDPKFVSQGKITDSQGNEVAGGYMPSTQTIRLNNLDSTSAYFDPITTAAHEAVHHLDNLATGTDFARVSESIFSPIASKWQGGKDLLSLLPRSVKSQYGKAGLEYLENQLASVPEGEKNPYEVRAYLIGARTHDRMYGTTPKNRNFIGKVLDFGSEFVERFANKISGVGWTSAGDTLNAISSGKLSQGLMNLGIVANPQVAPQVASQITPQKPTAAPPEAPAALADATAPTVEEAAVQPPKGKKKSKAAPTVDENAPITEYDNEPYVSPYGLKEQFSRASFANDTKIPNSRNGEFFGKGITNEEAMSLTRRLGTGIKPGRIYLPEGDDTRGRAHIELTGHIPELQEIGFNGIVDALEYVTSKRDNNDFNIGSGTSYSISAIKKVNGKDIKITAAIAPDLNDTSKHSVISLFSSNGKKPSERGATQVDRGRSERMQSLTPEQRRAMIMNKEQFSRAAAQTSANVEEFKRWWKRSKAVDTNGEPKRFYTGKATTRLDKDGKPFKSFTRAGSGVMLDAMGLPIPGMKGPFYFSPDPPFANQFAMRRLSKNDFKEKKADQVADGGRMIPVFLSVQDPFDFDNPEHVARIMQDQILKSDVLRGRIQKAFIEKGSWKEIEKTAVQGAIRRSGFDGFYLMETLPEYNDNNEPTGNSITSKNLAVYNPNQIKGVFNEFAPGTAESEQFSRARATGDQFNTDMRSRSDRKFGVYPYLRAFTNVLFDHKRKIMAGVNPNNAALQIQYLNELERNYPNPLVDNETFTTMASDAFGSAVVDGSVPLPPYNAIRMVQDPTIIEQQIGRMSPSQRQMAEDGFKLGKRVKAAYVNGKMTPSHTAKLVLWGILSRGVSPFIQESAFLDVVTERGNKAGIGYFIESALNGEFNKREYLDWSNMIMPESSPGNSTKHNLNGFGNSLMKLSETLPSGKTLLQELHDMIADYRLSGKEIRRRFHSMNTGIGINNKVLSFVLLVSGRTDVVVLDRVQMRNLFNDGRFDSYNLYDGEKIPKMVKNQKTGKTALKDVQDVGTNMNKLGDDMVGLMYYEAIERGMKDAIKTAYNNLGRGDGSPGQFHWESWVATSAQEVDHGSIEGILRDALGVVDPYYNIHTRQGKYDEFSSGMIYGYDKNAAPYVDLPDGLGNFFRFTPSDGKEVLDQVKKPANGIVPENFKVSQNVEGPWYNNRQVNKAKLNQLYSQRGTLVHGNNAGLGKINANVIGRRNTAAATASAVERAIARSGEQFSRAKKQSNIVEEARVFATEAHAKVGQLRKYTNDPYIVHPEEVMQMVRTVPHTDAMLAATLLHDVVEDTGITSKTVREKFGDEVADLVGWLTDVSKPEQGNRAVRKAIDREHTAAAPAEAQTIKLADLISNTRSIVEYDKKFAKVYLEEKRLLLDVMTKGDATLMAEAKRVLEEGQKSLTSPREQFSRAAIVDAPSLNNLPKNINIEGYGKITAGPFKQAREAAYSYMQKAGLPYNPPTDYVKVDVNRAKRIADAYEAMADAPQDPEVKASYDQLIRETMDQWEAIKETGLKVEFFNPKKDPYKISPRLATEDVRNNNHLWVFSTDDGYGTKAITAKDIEKNPMLATTKEIFSGRPARVNDIFRVVHDYFGHIKEGNGFRADGEENAWRSHASMYSPLARRAMTSETRGQNSWLNYGPFGEKNRTAQIHDTVFADQKVGLMPEWTAFEGAKDFLAPSDEQFSRANQRQKDILKNMMAPPNNKGGIEKFASEVYVKDGSLGSGLGGLKVRFIQGLFDYLAPLKLIAPNAYKKFRIANNSASIALSVIANGPIERFNGGYRTIPGAKSLIAIIDGIGKKYGPEGVHLWTGYMAAKRSKRLILEGRESLMTQADIDEMLKLSNQYPEFETARKEWIEFNDKNVDFARANGTLTAREAASWKANGDYIPFYRALDDDGGLVAPGVGTLARQSDVSKKLKGSDKQLGNILENMILNTDLLVRKAIRNDALRSLEREAAGTGALQKISGITPTSVLTTGKSIADEIADHLSKVMGIDRTDPAFDVIVQPIIDATDMSDAGLISLFGFRPNMDKDVMVVRGPSGIPGDTSTKRYYKIKDPLLVTALTFVPPSNLGFMRLLTAPKTLFTRAITMAPPFMAANLFRDTLQARVLSNAKTIPFFDTTKGLYASLRNTQGAKDLQAGGGSTTNNYDSSSLNRYKKLTGSKSNPFMVTLGNAWGALEAIGNATEVANRIAIREAKLKSGASLGDANFEALDIMDFSLRGSNVIVNFIISTVPFMNARLQGMYKLGRAGYSKENRANFLLMGSMFALASLGLAAMNEDDERYQEETDVSKDNYIHIYLDKFLPKEALIAAGIDKWTEDFHIALPKPFEIGAVFMTIPERMYNVYKGTQQAKDLRDSVWGIVGTTFKMHPVEMIPYPAKIAAEQVMNVDLFRKQDIVPDYKRAPGFEEAEYKYDTPEILKAFSQAVKDSTGVGISPLRAEKLIRDFAGTFGEYFMMAGDMAYREMNGMPQPINESLLDSVTGASRFLKPNSPAYSKHKQDFYNLSKDIKSIVRVLDTFDKESPEKAEKFEEANGAYLAAEKKANKVSKQLSDLRSAKEQIYREGGPDAEAEIKDINAEENELTKEFMVYFRELEAEH